MSLVTPFPLPPEDEAFRDQLEGELVAELFRRAKPALVMLGVMLVLIYKLLGEAPARQPLLKWVFAALAAVVAARISFHEYVDRRPEVLPSPRTRHGIFMAGTFLVGLGYAALNLAAYPVLETANFGMLVVSLTGINAGALLSMSPSPASYFVYLLPSIGSLVALTALSPKPGFGYILVLLLVFYLPAMMILATRVHRSLQSNILLRLRLGEMALRDSLTGLRNRRYLTEFMEREWKSLLRAWHAAEVPPWPRSGALVMLDIDHFKRINDTHGHLAGDAVLRQFARVLLESVRQPDVVVRWGGEEFVVVAMDIVREPPFVLAERIRARIQQHAFVIPGDLQVPLTCSIGYACLPFLPDRPSHLGWEDVMNLADGALYQAKQRGRNRTLGVHESENRRPEALAALINPGKDLDRALEAEALRIL